MTKFLRKITPELKELFVSTREIYSINIDLLNKPPSIKIYTNGGNDPIKLPIMDCQFPAHAQTKTTLEELIGKTTPLETLFRNIEYTLKEYYWGQEKIALQSQCPKCKQETMLREFYSYSPICWGEKCLCGYRAIGHFKRQDWWDSSEIERLEIDNG